MFFIRKVIQIPMHVLLVGGLLVTAPFKALDTARYLHKPIRMPVLTLRSHIDASCVVLPSEENDDHSLSCGAQIDFLSIGTMMWAHDLEKRQHCFSEKKRKSS
ncbi:hypothetical protein H4582DRAFT_1131030 [Lactarius indigo]|nr:hypothetical protein H4582DRAFT_1131030 [Lactarius indigo]